MIVSCENESFSSNEETGAPELKLKQIDNAIILNNTNVVYPSISVEYYNELGLPVTHTTSSVTKRAYYYNSDNSTDSI
ncbi:hypothetical protein [uncultured Winogradskyella sp.]|uniref:hypothetical protein n=1 Tax=uncultured Winogradskyella sp. TaxID=395353 RepID=UPI0030DD9BFD